MSSTPTHGVRSPSWPENRRAPGRLELVRRLLNTVHLETGVDLIADRVTVGRWLASEGFATGDRVTQAETERVHEFRTRLRASIDNPNVPATDTTEWLFSAERQSVQFVLIDDVPMLEGAADAATDPWSHDCGRPDADAHRSACDHRTDPHPRGCGPDAHANAHPAGERR